MESETWKYCKDLLSLFLPVLWQTLFPVTSHCCPQFILFNGNFWYLVNIGTPRVHFTSSFSKLKSQFPCFFCITFCFTSYLFEVITKYVSKACRNCLFISKPFSHIISNAILTMTCYSLHYTFFVLCINDRFYNTILWISLFLFPIGLLFFSTRTFSKLNFFSH